jgi:hypothetical protein
MSSDPKPINAQTDSGEQIVPLREWAVHFASHADAHLRPGFRARFLSGLRPDGLRIQTSELMWCRDARLLIYETANGSLYQLEGKPEGGYARWCEQSGQKLDVAAPIHFFRGTPDDERPADPARDVAPRRPEVSR